MRLEMAAVLLGMWAVTGFAAWLAAKHNDSSIATPFMLLIVMIPAAITTAQFAK